MKNITIASWQDYWKLFDALLESLVFDGKQEIVEEFQDARKYVNGLTDGWYEFMYAFDRVMNARRMQMTDDQCATADFLRNSLYKSLSNRR